MSEVQLGGGWTIEKVREEIIEHIWIDETGDMGGVHCMHCLGYEQVEIDRILILSTQTLRDERDRLRTFLDEALEEWEYSCQYKSEYLREKHGDLERIAEIKAALTPAGGGSNGNTKED